MSVPVVHAVTTRAILARPDFLGIARGVMRVLGPRGALHVRAERWGAGAAPSDGPSISARMVFELAESLVAEQAATGAWLVVNDRVDIALMLGARAVQLPSYGLAVAQARTAAHATGRALECGVSVHAPDEARTAADAGAVWVIAGPVYVTPTHPGGRSGGIDALRGIVAACGAPVIAIGGLRPGDVGAVRAAGAAGVAVVRGIWSAADAEDACVRYLSAYDEGGDAGGAAHGPG